MRDRAVCERHVESRRQTSTRVVHEKANVEDCDAQTEKKLEQHVREGALPAVHRTTLQAHRALQQREESRSEIAAIDHTTDDAEASQRPQASQRPSTIDDSEAEWRDGADWEGFHHHDEKESTEHAHHEATRTKEAQSSESKSSVISKHNTKNKSQNLFLSKKTDASLDLTFPA